MSRSLSLLTIGVECLAQTTTIRRPDFRAALVVDQLNDPIGIGHSSLLAFLDFVPAKLAFIDISFARLFAGLAALGLFLEGTRMFTIPSGFVLRRGKARYFDYASKHDVLSCLRRLGHRVGRDLTWLVRNGIDCKTQVRRKEAF